MAFRRQRWYRQFPQSRSFNKIKVAHLSPIPYLPRMVSKFTRPFSVELKVKFNLLLGEGKVLTKTRDPCNLLSPPLPDRIIFPSAVDKTLLLKADMKFQEP